MAAIKVAINGFGRIGRLVFRILENRPDTEVVAVNDLSDVSTLVHLLRYDTSQGRYSAKIETSEKHFTVNGRKVSVLSERDPADLPWNEMGIDVVIESTGVFRDAQGAGKHLSAGAGKVIISAPAKGGDVKTVVMGVNDTSLTGDEDIVSNASCTTNCLAPIAKVLHERFGIQKGYINTIHAYTADQRLQDAPHKDLRRARAAAQSIIPTTTGAAKSVGLVIPELKGKLDGMATRVPVITGSMTDLTVVLDREATPEEINRAIKEEAEGSLNGIVEYSEDPLVSADIIGNPHSAIFDSLLTSSEGNLAKLVAWYDNEYGYAARTADLIPLIYNG